MAVETHIAVAIKAFPNALWNSGDAGTTAFRSGNRSRFKSVIEIALVFVFVVALTPRSAREPEGTG
jgi:hypothetical protein